ncbi:sugar ABC transporter substrate-binding protein [Modestobacter marinus]|uniref:N,N'-diacetylchitobiose transport system substrate-binding protein n=1 Tax=Modestobacter marinus TaxID=477641 RepID=A0A846LFH8_9ACTN|nr:extracellular solute-binding protein [Modestobacter marinus]NIH66436.1 N,N'-diacetylchitobiose transport system substrate-binding protein [Modestobacter marinus]GGL63739.1 sugar ABC transporter substrate-binding protein [Modestobacter marinus]
MKRVRTSGLAALAVGMLALTACGGGEDAADSGGGGESGGELRLWLAGSDTPQELRDHLVETFEAEHPDATLVIEEQDWNGLVPRLQTALTSESQTPDLVEIGNTQSPTFTYAGAFSDISDMYEELGGDDLLQGFVDAGTVDDTLYAVPYYSGARAVFYNKEVFAAAGVEVPTTLAEFTEVAQTLQQANPTGAPSFSGFWLPGQDWYNGVAWLNSHGGELAVEEDGEWTGALSSPESQEGLAEVQELFTTATSAPRDADSNEPWIAFNNGEAAMFSAPTWARWSIDLPACNKGVAADDESEAAKALLAEQQACNEEKTGIFALPGLEEGSVAPVFAGGSNIGIPAKSGNQELARDLLRIIFSPEYQTMLAENGLIPGNTEYADALGDDVYAQAALAAAVDAELTPPAEKWADVEGARILEDLFQEIASGTDPATAAAEADQLITDTLN